MEIFRLVGNILVDNTAANESMSKTDEKGKNLASTLGDGIKTAAKWGAGIATAATAAVAGLTAAASKTAETADTFDKASLRTGLEVEELQRLNYAAGQSGVSLESLEKSAKKMNERLGEVSEGNEKSIKMFDALGVSIKNSDGTMKASTDIYNDTLLKLAEMGDTAKATAIGTDLFGKAFVDMKPLLAEGASGIEELKNRADELGIVMSGDAVAAGVTFGDTMEDIKASFGGVFNELMISIIPILQTVADLILNNMPVIQSMVSQFAPIIIGLLTQLLPPLMSLAQTIMPIIFNLLQQLIPPLSNIMGAILPVITKLLNMLLPPILKIVELILPLLLDLIEPLLPLLEPIIALLQPIIDLLMLVIEPLVQLLDLILPPLIEVISLLIGQALEPLQMAFETAGASIGSVVSGVFEGINTYITMIQGAFNGLIDFITGVFTGNWKKAWEGVQKIFGSIFEGMKELFKIPINWIIEGINRFLSYLSTIEIPDWVPKVGGKGFDFEPIPMLFNGGEIQQAGRVLVGEKGPEFLDLPRGAKVTPLDKAREVVINIIEPNIYDDRGMDILMDKVVNRLREVGAY